MGKVTEIHLPEPNIKVGKSWGRETFYFENSVKVREDRKYKTKTESIRKLSNLWPLKNVKQNTILFKLFWYKVFVP